MDEKKYSETLSTWNNVAQLYEAKFMDNPEHQITYDSFLNKLPITKANILEVGCGPGNLTRYLKSKKPQLNILGIDYSQNMIALAEKNVKTVQFKVMDARNINTLKQSYDGIIAGFCLPYLSQKDGYTFLENSYNLLKKSGVLYVSYIEGNDLNSQYISAAAPNKGQMHMYYHNSHKMLSKLKLIGFEHVETFTEKAEKPSGQTEVYTILILRKQKRSD